MSLLGRICGAAAQLAGGYFFLACAFFVPAGMYEAVTGSGSDGAMAIGMGVFHGLLGAGSFAFGRELRRSYGADARPFVDFAGAAVLCVLGLGAFGFLAITQFHHVVERAKLSEVREAIQAIDRSQEAFRARHKRVVVAAKELSSLDAEPPPLRHFKLETIEPGSGAGCPDGRGYALTFRRIGAVALRWGEYRVRYDSCRRSTEFPGCEKCTADFADR